ncbi:hypothetical protein DB32_007614 [Sandaracinus amylolyticus]|uniref:Uncharacterized protein n=1 Tax=Sandaracinus amylolyticus TaxID=927083 RepID=A0A0F6W936_9BACT|nr:hypothetical protein DB32_007614 [Sandaracinus amylolyticus]
MSEAKRRARAGGLERVARPSAQQSPNRERRGRGEARPRREPPNRNPMRRQNRGTGRVGVGPTPSCDGGSQTPTTS